MKNYRIKNNFISPAINLPRTTKRQTEDILLLLNKDSVNINPYNKVKGCLSVCVYVCLSVCLSVPKDLGFSFTG